MSVEVVFGGQNFDWKNHKERDQLEDEGRDGRIILK